MDSEINRAAAICENCGTAHSVRIGPEGEIRPIGTGRGTECTCGDGDLHILSDDSSLTDGGNSKSKSDT